MSAPPIGMMISTPSRKASALMTMNGIQPPPRKNQMPKPIIAMAMARLTKCWPGNTTGAPLMRPDSLPNAITDPEKVIAPMNVPRKSSSLLPVGITAGNPNETGLLTAATAISTAARPTSEWNAATSSGICVICTRFAMTAPIAPPTAMPTRIIPTFLVFEYTSASVTTTAIAMPMMPNRLPRRAVDGWDSPFSAKMKEIEATRYQRAT